MRLKLSYIKNFWNLIFNNPKLKDEIQKNKINFEKKAQSKIQKAVKKMKTKFDKKIKWNKTM